MAGQLRSSGEQDPLLSSRLDCGWSGEAPVTVHRDADVPVVQSAAGVVQPKPDGVRAGRAREERSVCSDNANRDGHVRVDPKESVASLQFPSTQARSVIVPMRGTQ